MAARALKNPAKNFSTLALPVITLMARRLVRISSYDTNEPHFGRTASHRFDDPKMEYGTSYFGLNLATAVAPSRCCMTSSRLGPDIRSHPMK